MCQKCLCLPWGWAALQGEQGGFPQGHKGEDEVEELENQYSTVSMGYLNGGRRKKQIKSRKEER